ncbi:GtrA family protein [Patescibacteria group bacterium]|nr:MAG: GtrA family protein [Patescibacteria group bacterium]
MRVAEPKKRDLKIVIFSLIGIFNTLFDLVLYVIFQNLTHSILIANIIATSAALTGSYFLNSRLTFKSKKWNLKSFVLFVSVTIFGLWFLQTGFIYLVTPLMNAVPEFLWHITGPFEDTAKVIVPKVLSVVVTFAWNFIWYNKVIFKKDSTADQVIASLE